LSCHPFPLDTVRSRFLTSEFASVVVYGRPVPKQRPRVTSRGAYTPKPTVEYRKQLEASFVREMAGREPCLLPMGCRIAACLPIPGSWRKADQLLARNGQILPTGQNTGDVDNYEKAAMDAANGIVYVDDAQVVEMQSVKIYHEKPCIVVSFYQIELPPWFT